MLSLATSEISGTFMCLYIIGMFVDIALQLRPTKVFCDNSEETNLCHCEICVLMLDAVRKIYFECFHILVLIYSIPFTYLTNNSHYAEGY